MTPTDLSFRPLFPQFQDFSLYRAMSCELVQFPRTFKHELISAATEITNQLFSSHTLQCTQANITESSNVLDHRDFKKLPDPFFMAVDLAYAPDNSTNFKLIEAQSFPSVSHLFYEYYKKLLNLGRDIYLDFSAYDFLINKLNSRKSILLEDMPWSQRTSLDFHILKNHSHIDIVDFRSLTQSSYEANNPLGNVDFIYNRLIFADLKDTDFLRAKLLLSGKPADFWLHHPDWYYFVSKASLPYIKSDWVTESFLVSQKPANFTPSLNEWVLKPLFDYGCSGVNLAPTKQDVDVLSNPHEWLLQRKIHLKPLPGLGLYSEVRVILFKLNGQWKPVLFLSRVNDKPFLGAQHFNTANPACGAAAVEFV